jgi:hypothetical protein
LIPDSYAFVPGFAGIVAKVNAVVPAVAGMFARPDVSIPEVYAFVPDSDALIPEVSELIARLVRLRRSSPRSSRRVKC